jgi:LmbE family N-acetylglucosaminyl deacetylase
MSRYTVSSRIPEKKTVIIIPRQKNPAVLALGAYPDDVELGAGGLIARLIRQLDAEVHMAILTYGTRH